MCDFRLLKQARGLGSSGSADRLNPERLWTSSEQVEDNVVRGGAQKQLGNRPALQRHNLSVVPYPVPSQGRALGWKEPGKDCPFESQLFRLQAFGFLGK